MDDVLTIAQIEARFESEWVLVEDAVTTGSGVEFMPRVILDKLGALGLERTGFPVLCHTLPPSAAIDGLLGLDFFRGRRGSADLVLGAQVVGWGWFRPRRIVRCR